MPNIPVHYHQVKSMKKATKARIQAILSTLSVEKSTMRLVLDKDHTGYVARQGHDRGVPHPLVEILTKAHTGVVVMWDGEIWDA